MTSADIGSNVLYRGLLDSFRQQFDVACRQGYVIALPRNEALQNVDIDQFLVNSHILIPSKLLKSHYTPLQVNHASDDIELDGRRLIIHKSSSSSSTNNNNTAGQRQRQQDVIKILAQETGYNSENKPFRLLLIERPLVLLSTLLSKTRNRRNNILNLLVPGRRRRLALGGSGASSQQKLAIEPPRQKLFDYYDCAHYLEGISQKLLVDLMWEIRRIQSNYMILGNYLQDAADKISQVAEHYIPRFVALCDIDKHPQADQIIESIRISVETYSISLLHDKLIASTFHRYERQDAIFAAKLELLKKSRLTVCQLGAQEPFGSLEIDTPTRGWIENLGMFLCPLAMVNQIDAVVDRISKLLDDCVKSDRLMMELETGNRPNEEVAATSAVSICSDDLIAALIYAVVQTTKPIRLYSYSKYLELFNWSARDRTAYSMATFHVVVQYIYSYQAS